jgi:Tat protein secretion system quality control protein TatD with DNase activity
MDIILDAHCHLADPRLYPDLDGALARADGAAVGTIVAVGAIDTIETDRLTVEIAERHSHVFAAIGVHPHNAADCDEARIAARKLVELGFYVSFSGILTFKKADALRAAAMVVPEDRLLIETDAPYLAPEPYRGKPNEPAYVRRTFEAIVALRGTDASALAARIRDNAARLFSLPAR